MVVEEQIASLVNRFDIDVFAAVEAKPLEKWIHNSESLRQHIEMDPHLVCKETKCVLLLGQYIDWEYMDVPGYAVVSAYYPVANRLYDATGKIICELNKMGVFAVPGNRIPIKPYALIGGIGEQGRNSLLITRHHGSRVALSAVLIDRMLHYKMHNNEDLFLNPCDTCLSCVANCPTNALQKIEIDSERCLRRWMLAGESIPVGFRSYMKKSLLGCDRCQVVCPKNLQYSLKRIDPPSCLSIDRLLSPDRSELVELGMLIGRNMARRNRVIGQAAIIAGNSGDDRYIPALQSIAESYNGYIEEHAVWAIKKLSESNI